MGRLIKGEEVTRVIDVEFFVCDSCGIEDPIDASGSPPLDWIVMRVFIEKELKRVALDVCDNCAKAFTISEVLDRYEDRKEQENG